MPMVAVASPTLSKRRVTLNLAGATKYAAQVSPQTPAAAAIAGTMSDADALAALHSLYGSGGTGSPNPNPDAVAAYAGATNPAPHPSLQDPHAVDTETGVVVHKDQVLKYYVTLYRQVAAKLGIAWAAGH